ncbi:hypothetical protein NUM3379_11800 [Kineococcus sp. NUM-3379]
MASGLRGAVPGSASVRGAAAAGAAVPAASAAVSTSTVPAALLPVRRAVRGGGAGVIVDLSSSGAVRAGTGVGRG